jgi:hypothetical protein
LPFSQHTDRLLSVPHQTQVHFFPLCHSWIPPFHIVFSGMLIICARGAECKEQIFTFYNFFC